MNDRPEPLPEGPADLLAEGRVATDADVVAERARSGSPAEHGNDFLAMVAHDMRNLLNGIVLSVELLQSDDAAPSPHVAAATGRIRRYVSRLNRLMGDLVDVTSIEAGTLTMSPVPGDAAALVAEATATLQAAAREKGVSLAAEVPPARLFAEFDPDRMLQVLANLVVNAIQFTPPGGRIVVRVEAGAGMLRFTVRDTGIGIPAAQLESVFERAWKVGARDRKSHRLGLYLSKSIVEAHGGRIWAESEEGEGSRLHFTLPLPGSPS